MRGKLAEPNLTRRLAFLAEARRDDPRVSQHLIEARLRSRGCKQRYWALPRLHASRQPHILCATLLTTIRHTRRANRRGYRRGYYFWLRRHQQLGSYLGRIRSELARSCRLIEEAARALLPIMFVGGPERQVNRSAGRVRPGAVLRSKSGIECTAVKSV
jgi:hypothetical protein